MASLVLKKKGEKDNLQDCVAYLLQYCDCIEKSEIDRKFCLDVAKKALFLYNLSPNSFGRSKAARQSWLDAISGKVAKYESTEGYHV